MSKQEIIDKIQLEHENLVAWLEDHDDEKWIKGPEGKWTTGEQVIHLIQSLRPLNKALRIPKFLLSYKFGKANRPSRDYAMVVEKYNSKLAQNPNVVAPTSRNMPEVTSSGKSKYLEQLEKEHKRLIKVIQKWSESQLDKYILPHPLMGRMPIRELLMWTSYHTKHHTDQLKSNY